MVDSILGGGTKKTRYDSPPPPPPPPPPHMHPCITTVSPPPFSSKVAQPVIGGSRRGARTSFSSTSSSGTAADAQAAIASHNAAMNESLDMSHDSFDTTPAKPAANSRLGAAVGLGAAAGESAAAGRRATSGRRAGKATGSALPSFLQGLGKAGAGAGAGASAGVSGTNTGSGEVEDDTLGYSADFDDDNAHNAHTGGDSAPASAPVAQRQPSPLATSRPGSGRGAASSPASSSSKPALPVSTSRPMFPAPGGANVALGAASNTNSGLSFPAPSGGSGGVAASSGSALGSSAADQAELERLRRELREVALLTTSACIHAHELLSHTRSCTTKPSPHQPASTAGCRARGHRGCRPTH